LTAFDPKRPPERRLCGGPDVVPAASGMGKNPLHGASRRVVITCLNRLYTARLRMHGEYGQRNQLMAASGRGLIHYKQRTRPMFGPGRAEIPVRVRHNPANKTRWICAASSRGDIQFVDKTQRKERHVRGNHDTKPGGSTAALSCGNPRHRYAARTTDKHTSLCGRRALKLEALEREGSDLVKICKLFS